MSEIFDNIIERCEAMVKRADKRVRMQDLMESAYRLQWAMPVQSKDPTILKTVDTAPNDGINTLVSAYATREARPKVNIPKEALRGIDIDLNDATNMAVFRRLLRPIRDMIFPEERSKNMAQTYEGIITQLFKQNDSRLSGVMRRDIARDVFIFDQIAIITMDLRHTSIWQNRREDFKGKSPFVFVRADPRTIFVETDYMGIRAGLHRWVRPIREIYDVYGKDIFNGKEKSLVDENGMVLCCHYWDTDTEIDGKRGVTAAWIEKEAEYTTISQHIANSYTLDEPQENYCGFVPIVRKTANGNDDDIMPMLYPLVESKMLERDNLALTLTATQALRYALQPLIVESTDQNTIDNFRLVYDGDTPITLNPMAKESVRWLERPTDKNLEALLALFKNTIEQSLMPPITNGLYSAHTSAAAISLISQWARTKGMPSQEALEQAHVECVRQAIQHARIYAEEYKDEDSTVVLWSGNGQMILDPRRIPRWMDITISFDPLLPSDAMALATVAAQLWKMQFFGIRDALEFAKVEDINGVIERRSKEFGSQAGMPQMDSPLPPSSAVQPSMIAGNPPGKVQSPTTPENVQGKTQWSNLNTFGGG
jgi:hypothetical protein